jgi:hypothetical protein
MYGKIFASTFTGSMVGSGSDVFAVWAYIIAHTGPDSIVEINPCLVSVQIGLTRDAVDKVIDLLCSPDHASRSKVEEGRRIEKIGEYSYHVINHSHYRGLRTADDRRAQNREAQKRFREKKSDRVSQYSKQSARISAHAESDAVSETYTNPNPPLPPFPKSMISSASAANPSGAAQTGSSRPRISEEELRAKVERLAQAGQQALAISKMLRTYGLTDAKSMEWVNAYRANGHETEGILR